MTEFSSSAASFFIPFSAITRFASGLGNCEICLWSGQLRDLPLAWAIARLASMNPSSHDIYPGICKIGPDV